MLISLQAKDGSQSCQLWRASIALRRIRFGRVETAVSIFGHIFVRHLDPGTHSRHRPQGLKDTPPVALHILRWLCPFPSSRSITHRFRCDHLNGAKGASENHPRGVCGSCGPKTLRPFTALLHPCAAPLCAFICVRVK